MTEKCKGLFGKHEFEVLPYTRGGFYIQCNRCRRRWEQNLMQTVPYGANSWAEWENKKKAELSRLSAGGLWQANAPTHYEGVPLEPEAVASLVAEYIIKLKHIVHPEDVKAVREFARQNPAGFMNQFYIR